MKNSLSLLVVGVALFFSRDLVAEESLSVHEHGFWSGTGVEEQHKFDPVLAYALGRFFTNEGAKSVVDFGCGTGEYVKTLRKQKIPCEGFDGNPDTPAISQGVAGVLDLSQPFVLKRKFDWVLSLEVGEHIPAKYESTFPENLHRHNRKGIILSWALPGQGGYGHVNEQSNEYIKRRMAQLGYVNDIQTENKLRAQTTLWWFKKTIMVFRKG